MASKKKYYSYNEFVSLYAKEESESLRLLERQRESISSADEYNDFSAEINDLRLDLVKKYQLSFADDPEQILNVIQKEVKKITVKDFQEVLIERRAFLKQFMEANPDRPSPTNAYLLTEENFDTFYSFIGMILRPEITAAISLGLSDEAAEILLAYVGKYYSRKETSLAVFSGKALDAIAQMSLVKPNIDKIADTATFASGDIVVVMQQFSQIKSSISINTHKLLMVALSEFAKCNEYKEQAVNLGVTFSATDYAADRGYDIDNPKKMKEFRRGLRNDLRTLKKQNLYWEETLSGHSYDFKDLSMFGFVSLEGDTVYMEFTPRFASYLTMLPLSQYSRNLLPIDGRSPNAYLIGVKLWEHYNIDNNIGKGTFNKLRVKNILKKTNLPSYEKIKSQKGSWEDKIKNPFEDALDSLVSYKVLNEWKYTGKNGKDLSTEDFINLTYRDWENLLVCFEIKDPKNHNPRITRKKKRIKSAVKKDAEKKVGFTGATK